MKTSLVIPAYNEEERIDPFLKSIVSFNNENPGVLSEIIVVDDGSSDKTIQTAKQFEQHLPQLKVIPHEKNRGKGAAVQTGVLNSTSDAVVFMDADGATPISEMPKMISALKQSQIGVGNRWMKGAKTERHSFLRQLSGWVYRNYMSIFGLSEVDTMCGFKGYRIEVAKDLFSNLIEERWLFDAEIAYKAIKKKYSVTNFPIEWESKDGSKLDTKTLLKTAFEIWPLISRIKKQQKNA